MTTENTLREALEGLAAKWHKNKPIGDPNWINGATRAFRECADELEAALAAHPVRVEAGPKYPMPCGLCPGQIESADDTEWHGLGNCVPICDRCCGSGIEPAAVTRYEALYNRVMSLLRNTKMPHGLCEPRERKACTHCNAEEELDKMLSEYKGARIVQSAAPPQPPVTGLSGQSFATSSGPSQSSAIAPDEFVIGSDGKRHKIDDPNIPG